MRIIIDTQSNALLRGSPVEQRYDQRGGLCQVGAGHLVLTTDPVDSDYLDYWRGLGLTLPRLLAVGPAEEGRTLSELVRENAGARAAIREAARAGDARLEFYCLEETERDLARVLDLPAYCSFDISLTYASKLAFKDLCAELGLDTVPWFHHPDQAALVAEGTRRLAAGRPVLVKAEYGMGGIGCGGLALPRTARELERAVWRMGGLGGGRLFLEELLSPLARELSVHWECTGTGEVRDVAVFEPLSRNCTYMGTTFPVDPEDPLAAAAARAVRERFGPGMVARGALGFYCCDVLAAADGTLYWNDFNPRKGASIYVRDMARRVAGARLDGAEPFAWHEGVYLAGGAGVSAGEALARLNGLLEPDPEGFAVVTNPGVIPYGRVDITGLSTVSRDRARAAFAAAKARLGSICD